MARDHGHHAGRVAMATHLLRVLEREHSGSCALTESFFSTVKSELGDQFAGNGDAEMQLFDYSNGAITSDVGSRARADQPGDV
jgi:hypothetical protein